MVSEILLIQRDQWFLIQIFNAEFVSSIEWMTGVNQCIHLAGTKGLDGKFINRSSPNDNPEIEQSSSNLLGHFQILEFLPLNLGIWNLTLQRV